MDAVKIIVASDYWDDKRSEGKKIGLYNQLHDKGYSELTCQKMISCVFGTVIPMDETNKEGLRVLCKYMKMSNNKLSLPSISNLYSFGSDNPIIEFSFPDGLTIPPYAKGVSYTNDRLADVFLFWIGSCSLIYKWANKNIKSWEKNPTEEWSPSFLIKISFICDTLKIDASGLAIIERLRHIKERVLSVLPKELASVIQIRARNHEKKIIRKVKHS